MRQEKKTTPKPTHTQKMNEISFVLICFQFSVFVALFFPSARFICLFLCFCYKCGFKAPRYIQFLALSLSLYMLPILFSIHSVSVSFLLIERILSRLKEAIKSIRVEFRRLFRFLFSKEKSTTNKGAWAKFC